MSRQIMCQMGNCLNYVGEAGLTVTLRSKTRHDETRAVYCCAAHAVAALSRLAEDRGEPSVVELPLSWRSA